MARRPMSGTNNWGYQHHLSAHTAGGPESYGQNFPQSQSHPNTLYETPSTDPWNWGWDEANVGSESTNNNPQSDPTWNWSVDGISGGYQEMSVPNTTVHYTQPASGQQVWTNSYPQQSPSNFTPQVAHPQDVIAESFSSSSVVNHPGLGQQQSVFHTTDENKQVHSYGGVSGYELHYVNNNQNENQSVFEAGNTGQNQPYFCGFHNQESAFEKSQIDSHLGEGNQTLQMGPFQEVQEIHGNTAGKNCDIRYSRGSGCDVLSPQWSTESLPSQGSDDVLSSSDSNRQSETAASSANAVTSSAPGSPAAVLLDGLKKAEEQTSSHKSLSHFQDSQSLSKPSLTETTVTSENVKEVLDSKVSGHVFASQPVDMCTNTLSNKDNDILPSSAPSAMDHVVGNMMSMSLGSVHTDVENIEIVPPENTAALHSACAPAALHAPPKAPPVKSRLGNSNPYAARGSSLNHKYANKHRTLQPGIKSESEGEGMDHGVFTSANTPLKGEVNLAGNLVERHCGPGNATLRCKLPEPTPDDLVNLETVPDNKERPDIDVQHEKRSLSPAVNISCFHQDSLGQNGTIQQTSWSQTSIPDNQEVYTETPNATFYDSPGRELSADVDHTPRNGFQSSKMAGKENSSTVSVDRELDRIIPGQGEETAIATTTSPGTLPIQHTLSFSGAVATEIEDINQRQVLGHRDNTTASTSLAGLSMVEDISSRAVPGAQTSEGTSNSNATASDSSGYLQRTVPGQNSSQPQASNSSASRLNPDVDDTPPPGLSRMVPGESCGPEGSNSNSTSSQAALDEPRVVTGLAEENSQSTGAGASTASSNYQPVPDEPRVVTGVAQDELDSNLGQLTSPISTSSLPSASSDGHETTDLEIEGPDISQANLGQLPSERSETIGSDRVETYPTGLSDTISRRDAGGLDSQRRPVDDIDSGTEGGRVHHANGRDYFGGLNSREREPTHDHLEGRRFRDRDRRLYERDDRAYEHEEHNTREISPRSRHFSYTRERGRFEEPSYSQRRHYEEQPHHGRSRYKVADEDRNMEDYGSDSDREVDGEKKRSSHERERVTQDKNWYREHEDYNRYRNLRHRDVHEVNSEYRSVGRDRDRDHERDRDRDRDWDREHDRKRERERYEQGRYPYDREYRRYDSDHAQYGEYYNRSRPSSRTGSHPEYEDERRRAYHQYKAYEEYQYRYYAAWRQYWEQQRQMQQQQPPYMPSLGQVVPEDRGSVHSGRSSAQEEIARNNTDRFHQTQYLPPYDYYYQQPSSSLAGDCDNNRSIDQNISVFEEATTSTPQRLTPAKFSTAHVKGVLTSHGQLVKILPHYPLDGQSATVEIHNVDQFIVSPATEFKSFPGPLIRGVTHKKSLMNFCMKKIKATEQDAGAFDRNSVVLLWRLLLLLLRQNGTVVGTDIAELLLSNTPQEASGGGSVSGRVSVGSGHSAQVLSPAVSQMSGMEAEEQTAPTSSSSKALCEEELTNNFREYLLYGNTQEALEWAMKHGLWGHALFLASKMDSRTYANVMTRFANGLTLNDPLQTLYQLMSGRLPAAVTCCADERWGDWRPHLAMILSNSSQQPDLDHRAITTLGDTLASRGCLHASHFCYLMAQLDFGFYNQKSSKLVLLGSSHTKLFNEFANNEAIQMTEIYIYACQLADADFELAQFQAYKLLYAQRLVEAGMPAEALRYVEVIAKRITSRPTEYSFDFMQRVFELGNHLKMFDLAYDSNAANDDMEELPWLLQLHQCMDDYMAGLIQPDGPSYGSTSNLSLSEGEPMNSLTNSDQHKLQTTWPQESVAQFQQQPQYQHQHQEDTQQAFNANSHYHQQKQDQEQQHVYDREPQTVYSINSEGTQGPQEVTNADRKLSGTGQQGQQLAWGRGDYYHDNQKSAVGPEESSQGNQAYWPQPSWDTTNLPGQAHSTVHEQQLVQTGAHSNFDYQHGLDGKSGGESSAASGYTTYSHPSSGSAEKPSGELPSQTSVHHSHQPTRSKGAPTKAKSKKEQSPPAPARSSWFGGLWSKLALRPKNQMILPEDKEPKIVWSAEKQRWINTEANEDETGGDLPPPPPKACEFPASKQSVAAPVTSNGDVKMPPQSGQNIYKMNRGRGSRANYVDVLGGTKVAPQSLPTPEIFPTSGQANPPANFFIPAPVQGDENASVDFLTSNGQPDTSLGGETSELSRWSSTSSLSKEVQKYMAHSSNHHLHHSQAASDQFQSEQQQYGVPLMYNPSNVNMFTPQSIRPGKKQYPN